MITKKQMILIAIAFAIVIYFFGRVGGYNSGIRYAEQHAQKITASDTTWFTEKETIEVEKPLIDTPTKVITKTFYIPVPDTASVGDSVGFDIPYIEAHASIPDTLDIYYHGYLDVGIDSVKYSVFKTTEVITNNISVEVAKMPKLALNFGLTGFYVSENINSCIYGKMSYTVGKTGCFVFGGYGTDFKTVGKPFFGVGVDVTIPIIK